MKMPDKEKPILNLHLTNLKNGKFGREHVFLEMSFFKDTDLKL